MRFASLDVYPKTLQEFRQRTLTGAIVSITTVTLIVLLAAVEIIDFAQLKTHEHLYVDTSRDQQLRINVCAHWRWRSVKECGRLGCLIVTGRD